MKLLWKILLVDFLIVLSCVYLVFFADISANWPGVISARKQFRALVWKFEWRVLPRKDLTEKIIQEPVKIVGQDKNTGEYLYSVTGNFSDLDIVKGIIYLTGDDKKAYGFYVGIHKMGALAIPIKKFVSTMNQDKKIYDVVQTDHILMAAEDSKYLEFLPQGSTVGIVFKDKRSLVEILKAIDGILNLSSDNIMQISKYENY